MKFFTSESVTRGHPDKICDQISDAVLDDILKQDEYARVACECAATTDYLLVMGEVTANADTDFDAVARKTIRDIGYDKDGLGFSFKDCKIDVRIKRQSPDIALGVDNSLETKINGNADPYEKTGAGDQGMMFGYATCETEELMPLPIVLSNKMCARLDGVRASGEIGYLRPDGKGQVTVEYHNGKPKRVEAVVLSAQHEPEVDVKTLRNDLKKTVIDSVIPRELIDADTKFFINPTGRFEIGGPNGDSGLTGRKIIADTYGGFCSHGGGSFSGKDCTKSDRASAYMARYICKNVVKAGLCGKCSLQVAYAIGVARPVSLEVETYGTEVIPKEKIRAIILKEFDLRPAAIIEKLSLRSPVFFRTSYYGHFGRDGFAWENTDAADRLKRYLDD